MKKVLSIQGSLSRSAVIPLVFLLLLGLPFLFLGPLLNTSNVRSLVERTVERTTGFSCRIGEIRFEYPLHLTLSRFSLEGSTGSLRFSVNVRSARLDSGIQRLIQGVAEEVVIQGVELDLEMTGTKKQAQGKPFKIPGWVWRIGKAKILESAVRVTSGQGSLCIEDLNILWTREAEGPSGRLRISLGEFPDKQEGLVFSLDPEHILPESGLLILPPLDLSVLLAFAGMDIPLEGTVSGAVGSPRNTQEIPSLFLALQTDNLSVKHEGTGTAIKQSQISADASLLFSRTGDPWGGIRAAVQLRASSQGITLMNVPLDPEIQPLALSGSISMDTGSDIGAWNVDAADRQGVLHVCSRGTLEGVFSGQMKIMAAIQASCSNLKVLEKSMAPWARLPNGIGTAGSVTTRVQLRGGTDSLNFRGWVNAHPLQVTRPKGDPLPMELRLSLNGALQGKRLRHFELRTERFRLAETVFPEFDLDYGPQGFRWRAKVENMAIEKASELLAHFMPKPFETFAWGGTLHLSGKGRFDPGMNPTLKGDFLVKLLDGRFNSSDFQKMGEGIEIQVRGTASKPAGDAAVEMALDAELRKGEVVYGALYTNLSPIHPQLHVNARLNTKGTRFAIGPSTLILHEVGTLRLKGRLWKGEHDRKIRAAFEVQDLHLKGLILNVLRDGLGGLYPMFETLDASGQCDASVNLLESKGLLALKGRLRIRDGSLSYPPEGLSAENIDTDLPFSLGNLSALKELETGEEEGACLPGRIKTGKIGIKGIRIPKLDIRLLLARDRVELTNPLRMELAEGKVIIPVFSLEGLLAGTRRGRASLDVRDVNLHTLAQAFLGRAVGGKLSARVHKAGLEEDTWFLEGDLQLRAGDGLLQVEEMFLNLPPSGDLSSRCAVRAEQFPLESLTQGLMETPIKGTVTGSLVPLAISDGKLNTRGGLDFSTLGGIVRISEVRAGGLRGPAPVFRADVAMEGIHLAELTSPLEFGRISGVLDGHVKGLALGLAFPYVTAFQADLETVKTRGVPRKIDATAVKNLSRMGGSNALAAALSSGLYRYVDEYYYKKIGLRATLEDGWLELHGIPKGGQEYLVLRALRVPTVSMPIRFFTPEPKIRFRKFISDILSVGTGG